MTTIWISGSLGHTMQEIEDHSPQPHSCCCSVGLQDRQGRVKKGSDSMLLMQNQFLMVKEQGQSKRAMLGP